MTTIFTLLTPELFAFAVLVTLLGGFVKGAVGFAMPLIMVSGMGILIDPQIVIATIILPLLATNALQVARSGGGLAISAMRDHWRYISVVCVMILIATQFVRLIPNETLFIVMGVPVVGLCLLQLAGWRPKIATAQRRPFEWITGIAAGILGGLSGSWGLPTVLYLLALETPRAQQMAIQGVIYGLGSVMLFIGHLQSGILNAQTWPLSATLVVPAFLGIWAGFQLGDRFDQERFRRVTLIVVVIAGANLIRRGVLG